MLHFVTFCLKNKTYEMIFYRKYVKIIKKVGEIMKGYIHSLESCGTVDGPGIRFVVFFKVVQCVVYTVITLIHGNQIREHR